MKKINIKAVLVGFITDIGGSFILGFLSGIIAGVMGYSLQELLTNSVFKISSFILGSLITVAGGYVATKVAHDPTVKHAFWVGILVIIFGFLTHSSSENNSIFVVAIIATVPLALLGGYIWHRTQKTKGEIVG